MDFIGTYGLAIWAAIALFCLALGTHLTFTRHRKRQQHTRLSKPKTQAILLLPQLLPSNGQRACPNCGKHADGPGACFCGCCGHVLESSLYTKEPAYNRRRTAGTHLIERGER